MNTIQKPKIPKELPVLSFTEALQDDLIKEVVIENAVVNSKLDGLRAEKVIFRNTVFTDVSFRHMNVRMSCLTNVMSQTLISAEASSIERRFSIQNFSA